ncbi:putative solid-state culture specific protein [Aspergillus affinis]|uniref:putative solid-state culture specific protein n=1 Tax=Aspergillus affinis TaxID=1070780 RepID=UPI0022FF1218|nr:uncharacterized protein KD926_000937 [Aspergillus affinis]KAI9044336.1 hypothetical protein KD926_000937 [Aspergillus affinis]
MNSPSSITLDYTLHDLYTSDSNDDPNTVLIYYPLQFGHNNEGTQAKFAYGYRVEDGDEGATSCLAMAANMVPQRYGFSAGKMPLVILNFISQGQQPGSEDIKRSAEVDPMPSHLLDIYRTFAQLRTDQRPSVSFAKSPDSIELGLDEKIAVLLPTDCLSHLPHLTCPETHYEVLSKRGLAVSGLPTPPSQVIDTLLVDYKDPGALAKEITRMTDSIAQNKVPFMVKLPQSISGMGTFAITSETDRAHVKAILTRQLGIMLQQLNQTNQNLYPCSIVLQDFIDGPVVALSFFVTKTGKLIYISCCEQLFDEHSHWIGGSISYRQQAVYKKTFSKITEKVAAFLHRKGYHGPAGIDIVTNQATGEQTIIDLNVRVTGTFHLGPLTGHFTSRGLFDAAMTTGDFCCSRDSFEGAFAEEIREGSLIVSGWVHDESGLKSHAAITIGARDADHLKEYLQRIRIFGLPN